MAGNNSGNRVVGYLHGNHGLPVTAEDQKLLDEFLPDCNTEGLDSTKLHLINRALRYEIEKYDEEIAARKGRSVESG